jgi:hypothetical protein
LESALANANICSNDTTVATVNLPAQTLVRAVTYYSNIYLFNQNTTNNAYKYNVNNKKYLNDKFKKNYYHLKNIFLIFNINNEY